MAELAERSAVRAPGPAVGGAACRITERGGLCLTQVIARRGQGPALAAALGLALPMRPSSTAAAGADTVLALRPQHWLLVRHDPEGRRGGYAITLRERLAGFAAVIDQSHGWVALRLEGPAARAILQQGLNLDLSALAFPSGAMAQAGLAGMAVLVHAVATDVVDLYGHRSYAESLLDWLLEAGQEAGIVLEAPRA